MATPEQWPKIKEIVRAALEREPKERGAYLDQACSKDRRLRAEVESLHCFSQAAIALSSAVVHPNSRTDWLSRLGGTAT
jgi:hypothetical protein